MSGGTRNMNVQKKVLRGAKLWRTIGMISLVFMQWSCETSRRIAPSSAVPVSLMTEVNTGQPKKNRTRSLTDPSRVPSQQFLHKHWEYLVSVDSDLRWIDVQICFNESVPKYLRADHEAAMKVLEFARWSDTKVKLPMDRERQRILVPQRQPSNAKKTSKSNMGSDSNCIDYRSSVRKILDEREGMGAFRRDHLVELAAGLWIWRPPKMSIDAEFGVSFDLPEDVQVAVSWKPDPGRTEQSGRDSYLVDTTALRWLGWIVLGRFERQDFRHNKVNYQVIVLDELDHLTAPDIRTWIQESVAGVNQLLGYSPISRAMITVAPNKWGVEPVSFGMVARGGGPSVLLLINQGAKLDEVRGNWSVIHEFLHLGMPFVQDAWMGEGFVSYYTEVMLTRLGFRSEAEGWKALVAAFDRGRKQSKRKQQSIQFSSNHMRSEHAYYHVYWGGAAIAFMLDVEMRKATEGRLTLDHAIRELHRCCANKGKKYRAKQLMLHLDKWYGQPIFSRLSTLVLEGDPFPNLRPVFAEVGIELNAGEVSRIHREVGHHMRSSIMGTALANQ